MTKAAEDPPPAVPRRVTPFFPPRPEGNGWQVHCPACDREVVTLSGRRCPGCDALLGADLPALVDAEVRPPEVLRHDRLVRSLLARATLPLWGPALGLVLGYGLLEAGLHVALTFLGGMLLLATVFLTPYLLLGTPVMWMDLWRRYRSVYPPRRGASRVLKQGILVERAWFDLTKVRGRRCLVLQLSLGVDAQRGRALEVWVRFRGPDGRYLPAALRRYRAPTGEALLRHRTRPLRHERAFFPRLWMVIPVRALWLVPGTTELHLQAEILLATAGELRVEHDLRVDFRPLPEDFPGALPPGHDGPSPTPGDIVLVGEPGVVSSPARAEAPSCGVCGDPLAEEVVRCELCEAPHHRECWEYIGGCTTFACEGRPEDLG